MRVRPARGLRDVQPLAGHNRSRDAGLVDGGGRAGSAGWWRCLARARHMRNPNAHYINLKNREGGSFTPPPKRALISVCEHMSRC